MTSYSSLLNKYNFIIIFTLSLAFMGGLTATQLPISLYTKIEKPTVRATMFFEQNTHSFYKNWGMRIERSLKAIKDVERVEANYYQNRVRYFVHFKWDANSDTAKQEVASSVSFYQAQLPKHLPTAVVDFFDPSSENYVAITSNTIPAEELSELLRGSLEPQLKEIDGVGATMVSSQYQPFVQIQLKPYKMLELDITLDKVLESLYANEFDLKLGQLRTDNGTYGIQFEQYSGDLESLRNIKIKSISGNISRLGDIADIEKVNEELPRSFMLDQSPIVAIAVWPSPDANLYEVSKRFHQKLDEFAEGVGDVVIINNPKAFIEKAILNIIYALSLGMATAAIVVLLFYRSLSMTMLIVLTMPIALLISFIVMKAFDVSINLLSLGAMGITIGMVIDCAVVIADHLKRTSRQHKNLSIEVLSSSLKRLLAPIFIATLTSILVFLPLAFTSPMAAALLKDLALVTISVLIASIFLSVFFVPALFMKLIGHKQRKAKPVKESSGLFMTKLIRFRWVFLVINMGLTVGSIYLIWDLTPKLKTEIVAQPRPQIIDVELLFKGRELSKTQKQTIVETYRRQIAAAFDSEIKHIYIDIRPNNAYLSLHLTSYDMFEGVFAKLGDIVKESNEANVDYAPWVTSGLNIKKQPTVTLSFFHQSEELNRKISDFVVRKAKEDSEVERTRQYPRNYKTKVIKANVSDAFLAVAMSQDELQSELHELLTHVKYASDPHKIFDIRLEDGELPIKVKYGEHQNDVSSLMEIPVSIGNNDMMLGNIVSMEEIDVYEHLFSVNGEVRFQLEMWFGENTSQQDIAKYLERLERAVQSEFNVSVSPFVVDFSDKETRDSLSSLQMALGLSLLLVFLVILYQFNNLYQSLVCISVALFGVSGAVFSLYWFGSTLSLNSLLGMLILIGLTVNNSILITDAFNCLREDGENLGKSIIDALRTRLVPLLVTNITTIVGMLPLAIGFGAGQDILKPLGVSVSGGLVVATISTMFFVPIMLMFSKAPEAQKGIGKQCTAS